MEYSFWNFWRIFFSIFCLLASGHVTSESAVVDPPIKLFPSFQYVNFKNYTSPELNFENISTIGQFDVKKLQKIPTDSDIFKWRHNSIKNVGISLIFFATVKRQNEQSCQFLQESVQQKYVFYKTSDVTSR